MISSLRSKETWNTLSFLIGTEIRHSEVQERILWDLVWQIRRCEMGCSYNILSKRQIEFSRILGITLHRLQAAVSWEYLLYVLSSTLQLFSSVLRGIDMYRWTHLTEHMHVGTRARVKVSPTYTSLFSIHFFWRGCTHPLRFISVPLPSHYLPEMWRPYLIKKQLGPRSYSK